MSEQQTPRALSDLRFNPSNPRTISASKRKMLAKSLAKFGDLGGIVLNRRSGMLVGGHQRVASIVDDPQGKIHLVENDAPTKVGTVAEGYIESKGERYAYREVDWDDATEKAANLAANKGAGEFDLASVAEWMSQLEIENFNLDLTMFDEEERGRLAVPSFEQLDEAPTRLDEKKAKECPSCGYQF